LSWIGESKENKTDLEVGLDLDEEFLEVLNNGAVDGATEVCMLIGHLPCLVADTVENILKGGERRNRRIIGEYGGDEPGDRLRQGTGCQSGKEPG